MQISFTSNKAKEVYNNGSLLNYQTVGSSGIDLRAVSVQEFGSDQKIFLSETKTESKSIPYYDLMPSTRALIGGGISIAIEQSLEVQMRSRSGLSWKNGVIVVNSPGTIDSDYRGEIGAILTNISDQPYKIMPGERVAQMVVAPVILVEFNFVDQLEETQRGGKGFGSTGTK